MTPMDITSTPFLSYYDINTDQIDLFEDAWGFCSEFSDVTALIQLVQPVPEDRLINRLIDKIRHIH
jgi:hypothetical protein